MLKKRDICPFLFYRVRIIRHDNRRFHSRIRISFRSASERRRGREY